MINLKQKQALEDIIIKVEMLSNALGAWDTNKVDPTNSDMEAFSYELKTIQSKLERIQES
ncbi:hypothetical protein [Vibrio sp. VB16]|uniref:hypothetical protein n=1 Tax=Vibrio sp. VB16 TaxID=2785746 RepID=UPI00189DA9BF|nr:hypothetical protein [Vibrio sp. VB16]UGA55307.1 hypothetical protein IUZ65_002845 [Vibrio sp. VB16]